MMQVAAAPASVRQRRPIDHRARCLVIIHCRGKSVRTCCRGARCSSCGIGAAARSIFSACFRGSSKRHDEQHGSRCNACGCCCGSCCCGSYCCGSSCCGSCCCGSCCCGSCCCGSCGCDSCCCGSCGYGSCCRLLLLWPCCCGSAAASAAVVAIPTEDPPAPAAPAAPQVASAAVLAAVPAPVLLRLLLLLRPALPCSHPALLHSPWRLPLPLLLPHLLLLLPQPRGTRRHRLPSLRPCCPRAAEAQQAGNGRWQRRRLQPRACQLLQRTLLLTTTQAPLSVVHPSRERKQVRLLLWFKWLLLKVEPASV